MSENKPVAKIHDGLIEAAIWKNETDNGHYYSASIQNTYVDENKNYQTSHNYSDIELLQLGRVANKADDKIVELRQNDKASNP